MQEKLQKQLLASEAGYLKFIEGDRLFRLLYNRIQRHTHFTDKEIGVHFPQFCAAWEEFNFSLRREYYAYLSAKHALENC